MCCILLPFPAFPAVALVSSFGNMDDDIDVLERAVVFGMRQNEGLHSQSIYFSICLSVILSIYLTDSESEEQQPKRKTFRIQSGGSCVRLH